MTTAQDHTPPTFMKSVSASDFRCFGEEQKARLAPLTLFVGDNSTGKSSLMALIGVLWEAFFSRTVQPNFNREPFDLGGFADMVHYRGGRGGRRTSFTAGMELWGKPDNSHCLEAKVTFREKDGYPEAQSYVYSDAAYSIEMCTDARCVTFMHQEPDGTSHKLIEIDLPEFAPSLGQPFFHQILRQIVQHQSETMPVSQPEHHSYILDILHRMISIVGKYNAGITNFAYMAPLRAQPSRVYLLGNSMIDPGAYNLPNQLITTKHIDPSFWKQMKEDIEKFGRHLGLFSQFDVVSVASGQGIGPFEMRVKGNPNQPRPVGPWRNLVDVGYGVSQILPLVCRLSDSSVRLHLIQQPEIHLHPKAQAALGSFLCEWIAEGRGQIIVESHSQYLLDRIRMEVRDSRIDIGAADVSVAFFEARGLESKIANIGFDDLGNVQGAPPGYNSFFVDEVTRSIGL